MDRGAWEATVHGVPKGQAQLSDYITASTNSVFWDWDSTYLRLHFSALYNI